MTGEYQESQVNIPASLEPVVVLVDSVGVHLHVDLLILQLRDVMNCLLKRILLRQLFDNSLHVLPSLS